MVHSAVGVEDVRHVDSLHLVCYVFYTVHVPLFLGHFKRGVRYYRVCIAMKHQQWAGGLFPLQRIAVGGAPYAPGHRHDGGIVEAWRQAARFFSIVAQCMFRSECGYCPGTAANHHYAFCVNIIALRVGNNVAGGIEQVVDGCFY